MDLGCCSVRAWVRVGLEDEESVLGLVSLLDLVGLGVERALG